MANTNKGFDVHGDEITFTGIPFATINGRANASQRAEAESELIHGPDGWVSEEDHAKAIGETESTAYDNGKQEGVEETARGQKALLELLKDALATIEANDDPDDSALVGQIRAALKITRG